MQKLSLFIILAVSIPSVATANNFEFHDWGSLTGRASEMGTSFNPAAPAAVANYNVDPSSVFAPPTGAESIGITARVRANPMSLPDVNDPLLYAGIMSMSGTPAFKVDYIHLGTTGRHAISIFATVTASVTATPKLMDWVTWFPPSITPAITVDVYGNSVPEFGMSSLYKRTSGPFTVSDSSEKQVTVKAIMDIVSNQTLGWSRGLGFFVPLGSVTCRTFQQKHYPVGGINSESSSEASVGVQATGFTYSLLQTRPWRPFIPGTSHTSGPARGFYARIKNSSGGLLEEFAYAMIPTDEGIYFDPLGAYSGDGSLELTSKGMLRKIVSLSIVNGVVQPGGSIQLHFGDINEDNAVDLLDYFVLSDYYGYTVDDDEYYYLNADGKWGYHADLNLDNSVDLLDYMIISDNYNLVGD